MGNGTLGKLVDEIIAIIIIGTVSAISAFLAVTNHPDVLKDFFTYFTAPLAVPIVSFFFGQKTARKAAEEGRG